MKNFRLAFIYLALIMFPLKEVSAERGGGDVSLDDLAMSQDQLSKATQVSNVARS
jgi:hypothetical protein